MVALIILSMTFISALMTHKHAKCSIGLLFFIAGMAMIICQVIGFKEAITSIDWDVMGFLFGTFIIAQGLAASGLSWQLAHHLSNINIHPRWFLLFFIYIIGLCSALLMNDTVAIIGTPAVVFLFRSSAQYKKLFIMALAMSITIGSIVSATGNPQNLLIATHASPSINYTVFVKHLLLPTILSLWVLFMVLASTHWTLLKNPFTRIEKKPIDNANLARRSMLSVMIFLLLIITHVFFSYQYPSHHIPYAFVALGGSLPLIINAKPIKQIVQIDWHTMLFFIGLFIISKSIWSVELFQQFILAHQNLFTQPIPMSTSVMALSQMISNVAITTIFLPLLQHASVSTQHYLLLAVSSTLAGNVFVLGAASNVIILQSAKKIGSSDFPIWQFFLIGLPTSLISLAVFLFYL